MIQPMAPASLDDAALAEIRRLEKEMDTVLVALDPSPRLAALSEQDLLKLRRAEERLGVVMVAYHA